MTKQVLVKIIGNYYSLPVCEFMAWGRLFLWQVFIPCAFNPDAILL
ncbi:hypothetical protein [Clostridium sp. DL-VIII]|nr:hypothetical protein [Clostridium sp. DL-VIII]